LAKLHMWEGYVTFGQCRLGDSLIKIDVLQEEAGLLEKIMSQYNWRRSWIHAWKVYFPKWNRSWIHVKNYI